jgi:hypothetical protein
MIDSLKAAPLLAARDQPLAAPDGMPPDSGEHLRPQPDAAAAGR